MTPADLIAGIRELEAENARLRAQVASLTAAPATTTEPGLDLDARVPCASCGGDFTWIEFPSDRDGPRSCDGRCACGVVWCDMPAPVTWRTLAAHSDMEVPAAYVARLVSEVDRQRALLTVPAFTATPTTPTDGALLPCPFCGRTDTLEMAGARSHYVLCNCGGTCVAGPSGDTESEAITRWNTRALLTASTPSPAPADNSGADPARGEGVSARACWTCKWALSLSECDHPARGWPNQWIRENCDLGGLPNDNARNCPGWAPKSGEVSDG